jgi:hypothetical protein
VTLDSARGNSNMTFDKVAVGGTGSFAFNVANDVSDLISLANGATLSLNGRDLIPNLTGAQTQNEYVLVNTVTGVSGTFASIIDSSPSYDFAVDYDGTDANPGKVVLVLTVIPEPASLSLLAVAAGGLLGRRRA